MLFAFVNLDKWNALPKHYQAVLEQAGHYANTWMMAKYDELNPPALRTPARRRHQAAWVLAADHGGLLQGDDGTARRGREGERSFKKVNDSMMDFTKNGYQWFQVAELGYDSFMVRHSRA